MTAQHMRALALGNAIKSGGCTVKREVREGLLSLAAALADPRAGHLKIAQLLGAQRGWGRVRVEAFLTPIQIHPNRRVDALTSHQLERIDVALSLLAEGYSSHRAAVIAAGEAGLAA